MIEKMLIEKNLKVKRCRETIQWLYDQIEETIVKSFIKNNISKKDEAEKLYNEITCRFYKIMELKDKILEEKLPKTDGEFRIQLASLLNRYSRENDSNTPDFILAKYLMSCLDAFNYAVSRRDDYYCVNLEPGNKYFKSKDDFAYRRKDKK